MTIFFSQSTKQQLKALAILLAIGATTIPGVVNAAENDEALGEYDLNPTVVTATKMEKKLLHTSADVSIITAKDIERMHYKSLGEALSSVPNVSYLNYTKNYTRNKILINGSHQVVVLVNGVRMSQLNDGSLSMNYGFNLERDLSDISRIEVLKGAASVLYGADAKGGVINIITKTPSKDATTISTEIGQNGHKLYGIRKTVVGDDGSVSVYARRVKDGSYSDASGKVWPSSGDSKEYGINASYNLDSEGKGKVQLNYAKSKQNNTFHDLTGRYKGQFITSYQNLGTLSFVYDQDFGNDFKNHFVINQNRTDSSFTQNSKKAFSPGDWGTDHYNTTTFSDTLTKKFDDKHTVVLGVEHTTMKGHGSLNNGKNDDKHDGNANVLSIYLQNDYKISPKWDLLLGYRYDKFTNSSAEKKKPHYSKSGTLTYNFDENTNSYIAYNEYFVSPTPGQLFNSRVGNNKLLPEIGSNKEFGINHMTADGTLLNFHYFKRSSKSGIGLRNKAGVIDEYEYANSSERVHGFDVNVMKRFSDRLSMKLGYAHQYIYDTGNYKLGYLPRNTITINTTYNYHKLEMGIDARAFIGRTKESRAGVPHPKLISKSWPSDRYWVVDLALNYKPDNDTKFYMKVNNLFNRLYAFHTDVMWSGKKGTWYALPGRNITFGVEWNF